MTDAHPHNDVSRDPGRDLGPRTVALALGAILLIVLVTRIPALFLPIHSFPSDTARWAAPAVNFATHGFDRGPLPLASQGDHALLKDDRYFRWPLLPFYVYGSWAWLTSDEIHALRVAPLLLNLVTTLYVFLIAARVFRRNEWALMATLLFALIPGHAVLSLQISDTQFWLVTLVGAVFHRLRYEQTARRGHMAAHLGLLVLGCFCSWFGYLSVAAHLALGTGSGLLARGGHPRRLTRISVINRYRIALVGIALLSAATQYALIAALAGDAGLGVLEDRFKEWVLGRRDASRDASILTRTLTRWPDHLSTIWSDHLPWLFGKPLVAALLATPFVIRFRSARVDAVIHRGVFRRVVVLFALCFAMYFVVFSTHAGFYRHTFTYQQLSPVVAIATVLVLAVLSGRASSARNRCALVLTSCLVLVAPPLIGKLAAADLNAGGHDASIRSARAVGEAVGLHARSSDLVITNGMKPWGLNHRVIAFTSRRTLLKKQNTWDEVARYLEDDAISGLVYLHREETAPEYDVEPRVREALRKTADRLGEVEGLVIYRLK